MLPRLMTLVQSPGPGGAGKEPVPESCALTSTPMPWHTQTHTLTHAMTHTHTYHMIYVHIYAHMHTHIYIHIENK